MFTAKQYLTMSDKSIESEVYRYCVFPSQACSYKVGVETIKKVIQTKFPDIDISDYQNLCKPQLIEFYKHLLWYHELPLQDLLNKYDVTFNF